MYFWVNALQIAAACLFCGFLATHSYALAVTVCAMQLFVAWLGGWFNVMDGYGLAMLILPTALAAAGAWLGAYLRRRQKEFDAANTFVPPPPPPGWTPRRRRRRSDTR
ncbi:hypothetical protein PRN20_20870 [Devosia sp. ZB163]|uniref:hypothetical protein n=1 Tax=Devosia sp. ZB163 TaxID=3025938 RepID=UPI00235DDD4F|nr:hypothetical protein [Devosia sp. ZB163]MDC9826195.1 hypothetical protein [Devosia sp. ZB163]